jgi:mannose-6-phosphate isomerase-like protein (cupin superfamily)
MATTEHARRGISIYRAADAVDLRHTDFMSAPAMSDETEAGVSALREAMAVDPDAGASLKVLVRESPAENDFSLVHVWFKANYSLPRHTHDVDCMYYVISGSAVMGSRTLRAGDSFFVPAYAPYAYTAGPDGVEILEIRHGVDRFDITIPDATTARWEAMVDNALANRERWAAERTSPTFAANQE